jgi:putative tricarboxylic transport membrane protein
LFLSNWLTSLLGLAVSGPLARTTVIRSDLLVPFVLALIAIAAVIYRGQPEDLVVTAAFGLFGYYLKKYGWPRVPFVIALVLGPMFEINLHLTTQLERLGRIHLLGRPIAAALALLIVLTLLLPFVGRKKAEA